MSGLEIGGFPKVRVKFANFLFVSVYLPVKKEWPDLWVYMTALAWRIWLLSCEGPGNGGWGEI